MEYCPPFPFPPPPKKKQKSSSLFKNLTQLLATTLLFFSLLNRKMLAGKFPREDEIFHLPSWCDNLMSCCCCSIFFEHTCSLSLLLLFVDAHNSDRMEEEEKKREREREKDTSYPSCNSTDSCTVQQHRKTTTGDSCTSLRYLKDSKP